MSPQYQTPDSSGVYHSKNLAGPNVISQILFFYPVIPMNVQILNEVFYRKA